MKILLLLAAISAIVYWLYTRSRMGGAPTIDISHLPEKFVIFDLETTGLDASKHQIIEIGAIRVDRNSNTHDTYQSFVLAKRKLPKKIVELTGITDETLKLNGVTLEEELKEFSVFIGDLRLISFNTDFDLPFLYNAASQYGIHFNNKTSCALKMAKRAWPKRTSYRLIDLARDGNLPMTDQHRALGDCQRALHVYIAAASKLRAI